MKLEAKILFDCSFLNVPTYKCFQKDDAPVDAEIVFDDACKDLHGNKHKNGTTLTSCCQCIL